MSEERISMQGFVHYLSNGVLWALSKIECGGAA